MSMVKMILFKPEKLKVRKVSRASLRSLMYGGSDDANFNDKCGEICQFFKKGGYSDSAVTTGKHRARN